MIDFRRGFAWTAACLLVFAASGRADETPATEPELLPPDVQVVLPAGLVTMDVTDRPLGEIVRQVAREVRVTVVVDPAMEERPVTFQSASLPWQTAVRLLSEKAGGGFIQEDSKVFRVVEMPRISYTTGPEGEEIKRIVSAISVSAGANIIVADEVSGKVQLQITDRPWLEVLENAVKTAGDYVVIREEGGVVRVVSRAAMVRQVRSRVFQLKYLRPPASYYGTADNPLAMKRDYKGATNLQRKDPKAAVEDFHLFHALRRVMTPEISSLDYDPVTNALIARDTQLKLDEVAQIIASLDVEPQQVYVDVKFVTTTNTDFLDYGIDWGGLNNQGPTVRMTGGRTFTRLPFNIGHGGFEDKIGIRRDGPTLTDIDNFLRIEVDEDNPTAFPQFGTLDFTGVQMVLRFIKRDVKSKVIQAPHITTLDNHPATIFVGEEVRYAQTEAASAESGGLTFTLEEAPGSPVNVGFQLLIIPRIIPGEDKLYLEVVPSANSLTGTSTTQPGFDTFSNGQQTIDLPRISRRNLVTEALIESGRTVVLGGLLNTNESEEIKKLPLLGDIPILGFAFKNRSRNIQQTNLTIFITPRVVSRLDAQTQELEDVMKRRVWETKEEFRKNVGEEE